MKISKAQYYVEDTDAVVNMMQVRRRSQRSEWRYMCAWRLRRNPVVCARCFS